MKLNQKKTKIMLFNRSTKYDFHPEIFVEDELLEVVESTKLLGVMVSSDLKWDTHISYVVRRVMKKLWMLRRVKQLGGSTDDLVLVYKLQIRCLTEIACPAWNGSLTKKNVNALEKLQKTAFKIILGPRYKSYENALTILDLQSLSQRRLRLCKKFATKTCNNPKFEKWFPKTRRQLNQRNNKNIYQSKEYYLPFARTSIYKKSPLYYLINLLNDDNLCHTQ